MDREAWRAAIHGVAKSRTWLSNWTEGLKDKRGEIWKQRCSIFPICRPDFDSCLTRQKLGGSTLANLSNPVDWTLIKTPFPFPPSYFISLCNIWLHQVVARNITGINGRGKQRTLGELKTGQDPAGTYSECFRQHELRTSVNQATPLSSATTKCLFNGPGGTEPLMARTKRVSVNRPARPATGKRFEHLQDLHLIEYGAGLV